MYNSIADKIFKSVDRMDAAELTACITKDGLFRFSNMEPVVGSENIQAFLKGFFESIKAISHSEQEVYETGNVIITNGVVTYTRHSGSRYRCNFSNTFKMEGDLVAEYLIFVDNSQLYNE
ncbi:MAG TPA: hypothetical protein DEO70_06370 [Bacteroidales bacterium]|nr:MAG: hypothetical protein A2X11_08415 [Bacteroidetes bacterium GWE2_42_24]OFY30945.1 MAG: hypothetical protein A2X09_17190 [Bacteroidetes bacterium GWF2_43_11]PKP16323.1 MAG: hypothetical protein CVU06_14870 [Bacteroidetes bacterium HGW-Bacteroidetes-22]HBZ66445.1 hypothetical protein [Bacteroidales bacterium]